jgi:hypothetical protein
MIRILSAWLRLDDFDSAVPHKGGHNDLSRWKCLGGELERPAAPAPISVRER